MLPVFNPQQQAWAIKNEENVNEELSEEGSEMEQDHEPTVGVLLCTYPGCLKEFSTRWSLNRHTRVHTGVKPYKCNFCFKEFAQNCSLKRHEQTHSQERVWVCDYQGCGKRFKLKEYLEVHHQRTHFKEEAAEPVVTNISEAPAVPAVPGANDPSEIVEKLRERLVRMGLRHHDQLAFHQQREQELLDALREVADTLDQSLSIIDRVTGGDPNVIPQAMHNVALRYSTKPSAKHLLASQMQTANGNHGNGNGGYGNVYAYSPYAPYAAPPHSASYGNGAEYKSSPSGSSNGSSHNFALPPSF